MRLASTDIKLLALTPPRYDKYALIYLGGVTFAATVLNHRSRI